MRKNAYPETLTQGIAHARIHEVAAGLRDILGGPYARRLRRLQLMGRGPDQMGR